VSYPGSMVEAILWSGMVAGGANEVFLDKVKTCWSLMAVRLADAGVVAGGGCLQLSR
jgi:hypothetical protein